MLELLGKSRVRDVVDAQLRKSPTSGLVCAVAGELVGEVAARMAARRVSAVPVFSDAARDACLGAVDFSDLAALMVAAVDATKSTTDSDTLLSAFGATDVRDAVDKSVRAPHRCTRAPRPRAAPARLTHSSGPRRAARHRPRRDAARGLRDVRAGQGAPALRDGPRRRRPRLGDALAVGHLRLRRGQAQGHR